jgi:hypothetical protein
MHLGHPVAQRLHDHLEHPGVGDVQRVAGAGLVDVIAAIAGMQAIVRGVVDAAKAQGRSQVVAFPGMIVHHVQNHFDSGLVQARHHGLELVDGAGAEIARFGGEEAEAVIAPIVLEPAGDQQAVVDQGMDRQQLDGGDAERPQVVDHRLGRQPGKGPACGFGNLGVTLGQAGDMGLVKDRLRPRHLGRAVVAPGEGVVDHEAFGHQPGTVAAVEAKVLAHAPDPVAEMGVGPFQRPDQCPGVGVDQQLVRVEAVPLFRPVRAVDPIAVKLARTDIGQIDMPDLVGVFGQDDAVGFALAVGVEQAQLDLFGMGRKQREIDPEAIPGGPQRMRPSRPDREAALFFRHQRHSAQAGSGTGRTGTGGQETKTGERLDMAANGSRQKPRVSLLVSTAPAAVAVPRDGTRMTGCRSAGTAPVPRP